MIKGILTLFLTNILTYQHTHTCRYKLLGINEDELPLCESLKDVTKRTSVFWDDVITPLLKQGKKIMIVGHENNLRLLTH